MNYDEWRLGRRGNKVKLSLIINQVESKFLFISVLLIRFAASEVCSFCKRSTFVSSSKWMRFFFSPISLNTERQTSSTLTYYMIELKQFPFHTRFHLFLSFIHSNEGGKISQHEHDYLISHSHNLRIFIRTQNERREREPSEVYHFNKCRKCVGCEKHVE